jgi:hypothetical protein
MPCLTSRDSVLPKPELNRKLPISSAICAFFFLGAHVYRHQRLGLLDGGELGEVHDVDRRLLAFEQVFERLVHGRGHVRVGEGDRAFRAGDHGGIAAGPAGQVVLEPGHVAERG